jgi:hypothetical protein
MEVSIRTDQSYGCATAPRAVTTAGVAQRSRRGRRQKRENPEQAWSCRRQGCATIVLDVMDMLQQNQVKKSA